ncbi:MAG: hypothetical protein KAW12_11825 [Candidatus Aminicenantes bacterium]|nr:hypothetical protein [Candidatus Aminicenantes bacterium]
MKKKFVICLAIVIGFVFSMKVYPDGFTGKYIVNFSKTNGLDFFKDNMFNYENKMVLYSWPLREKSTSLDNFENYNYKGLLGAGHLLSETGLANRVQHIEKPRLTIINIIGGVTLGIAGSIVLGRLGARLGGKAANNLANSISGGYIMVGAGFSAGSALGGALGVYIVGSLGNVRGRFGKALLGGALGAGIAFFTIFGGGLLAYLAASAVLPPLFAAIFFNRSLRYKHPPKDGNALLNFREGRVRFGIPLVSVQPLADFGRMGKKAFMINMNVLSIQL